MEKIIVARPLTSFINSINEEMKEMLEIDKLNLTVAKRTRANRPSRLRKAVVLRI